MSQVLVFPEPSTPRTDWMGLADPRVNFLLTSTLPEAITGRAWVNACYGRFPDDSGSLVARLRSTTDSDYATALDELFLHERLLSCGRVTNEEGGRGPDFRIYRGKEYLGAIEVRSIFMRSEWSDKLADFNRIADELNSRIRLGNWFVNITRIRTTREPSYRQLAHWVEDRLAELSVAADSRHVISDAAIYTEPGVQLWFRFLRRTSKQPPKETDRVTGIGPFIGGFGNEAGRLRQALKEKMNKKYELRGSAFAIWFGVQDIMYSEEDVLAALYGDERVLVGDGSLFRDMNGFFRRDRNTRVSCALVAYGWSPWKPDNATVLRFDNPFARIPFPESIPPVDRRFVIVDQDSMKFRMDWV